MSVSQRTRRPPRGRLAPRAPFLESHPNPRTRCPCTPAFSLQTALLTPRRFADTADPFADTGVADKKGGDSKDYVHIRVQQVSPLPLKTKSRFRISLSDALGPEGPLIQRTPCGEPCWITVSWEGLAA